MRVTDLFCPGVLSSALGVIFCVLGALYNFSFLFLAGALLIALGVFVITLSLVDVSPLPNKKVNEYTPEDFYRDTKVKAP